jgi:hypothetical protein
VTNLRFQRCGGEGPWFADDGWSEDGTRFTTYGAASLAEAAFAVFANFSLMAQAAAMPMATATDKGQVGFFTGFF